MIYRIKSLDHLRGLMAVFIMLYHYFSWVYGGFDSSSFWGRIGIYGVSIFYVLSGLTLFVVYKEKLFKKGILNYAKRRILRIHPLLILITIATVVLLRNYELYYTKTRAISTLALNLTGVFGFFEPKRYIATGAWSIGNELVFYFFFPFIMWFRKINLNLTYLFFLITFLVGCYFSFYLFDSNQSLSNNWHLYVNPFNQIFLFTGGIAIGQLLIEKKENNQFFGIVLVLSLIAFIILPVTGDRVNLTSGINRIIFSSLSLLIVLCTFKIKYNLGTFFNLIFDTLGKTSYTIYLLHPIIYYSFKKYGQLPDNSYMQLFICVFTTIVLSIFIYRYYERPFITMFRQERN